MILIEYRSARAKARVTGMRETFLPKARSDSRLCYFKQKKIMNKGTKVISVFVDESGSFDPDRNSSRYYSICMVFHDQSVDLSEEIQKLEDSLAALGLDRNHCVHAGPLIRREQGYEAMSREARFSPYRIAFVPLYMKCNRPCTRQVHSLGLFA